MNSAGAEDIKSDYRYRSVVSQFELRNESEIEGFIVKHPGLVEVVEKSLPIVRRFYPDYSYFLKYEQDPEFDDLSQLVLYVNGDDDRFDEDWKHIYAIMKELIDLEVSDKRAKHYFQVDLW